MCGGGGGGGGVSEPALDPPLCLSYLNEIVEHFLCL